MARSPNIAFSWNGLPQYAARLLRAAIGRLGQDCAVVGSKPSVPVKGMEEALGQKVHWVDAAKPVRWSDLGLPVPDIYFQSGWAYPAFSALGREVKQARGKIVGLSDANFRGDLRQRVLGPVAFRLVHRRHFDAMLVPGVQGTRLMRYFGMPASHIRQGMYGADPTLFNGGPPLAQRPKSFLFVGQFIPRKDVVGLARAFIKFAGRHPDWTLRITGSGAQRDEIPRHANIILEDFVQPEQLAERFRQVRFFVLPSLSEAWGLVVHEAALCGCALILSDTIGSARDMGSADNAISFKAGNEAALVDALERAAAFSDEQLQRAEAASRAHARKFGPDRFAAEVERLVSDLSGVPPKTQTDRIQ